jgi:hypothetical protein
MNHQIVLLLNCVMIDTPTTTANERIHASAYVRS